MGWIAKRVPMIGDVFTRLSVIGIPQASLRLKQEWTCRCSCPAATIVQVPGKYLVNGQVKSCGCLSREQLTTRHEHHRVRHAAKVSWKKLSRSVELDGIVIESRWRTFKTFFTDLGERPDGTLHAYPVSTTNVTSTR